MIFLNLYNAKGNTKQDIYASNSQVYNFYLGNYIVNSTLASCRGKYTEKWQ